MKQEAQGEIAAGAIVRGRITGKDPLRVLGRIEGEIALDAAVLIERGAVVKALVRAPRVTVAGLVIGDVEAAELVEVTAEGRIAGDVSALALKVAEGGRVAGTVRVGADRAAAREMAPVVDTEPELLTGPHPGRDLVRDRAVAAPVSRRRVAVRTRPRQPA